MCWHGARLQSDYARERRVYDRTESRPPDNLRVSQADRDAVIEQLRTHTADGRLDLEEFGERVDEVLAAKTRADLDRTLRELPRLDQPTRVRRSAGQRFRGLPAMGRVAVMVGLTFVAAELVGGWVFFLLFWLVPMALGGGCGSARHHATRDQWDRRAEAEDRPPRDTIRV